MIGGISTSQLRKAFNDAETLAKTLTFQHICDIWRPSPLAPVSSGDLEASDGSLILDASSVSCWYQPTPTFDERRAQGLTEVVNLETSDQWNLPATQPIFANWVIVMRLPGHMYYGRCWVVQGNSTSNDYAPIAIPQRQWVFAKLSPTELIPT